MLGFSALSEYARGEVPATDAAHYARPNAASANFTFSGTAYTRPAAGAANFAFGAAGYTGTASALLDFTAAAVGAHGVAGAGAVTLAIAADAVGEVAATTFSGVGVVTLDILAAAVGAHGVSGSATAVLDLVAAGAAAHGVAGTAAVPSLDITATGAAAHGVSGVAAITLPFTAAAVAIHERYELRGEVRLGGVLVNRQVRAYRRDTGALVGEAATVAGQFRVNTGIGSREHYIVPVQLDDTAVDWSPPTANRVVSVLAQDV